MRLLVRLANCNPVRVVEVNLPLTSSVAMLKQRVEALTGVNEFKQKIYCAGQFMDPDALLSSFELKDGMELKLLVKMSKITNKIAIDNGAKAAAAVPAHQANSGLMGLKELAGRLREAGSEDDEDDDEDESASGGSDTYSKDEEEAILYAAMRRVADSHKRARGAQK